MMASVKAPWLGLLCVACLAPLYQMKPCTQENLNECYVLMEGFEGQINAAVVPTLTPKQMKEHCSAYEEFEVCMADIRPNCQTLDVKVFEGIELAYEWICEKAFDEYEIYHDCLKNTDLHREGKFCNDTLTTKLNTYLDEYQSSTEKRNRICHYVEDYLDCVGNAVQSFCGDDAASWQRELDTRSLQPLLERIACPGWKKWGTSSSHWQVIVLAVLISLSILIIVVVAFFIFYLRRRKNIQREEMRATMNMRNEAAAPPPYTGPSDIMYIANGHASGVVMDPATMGAQDGPVKNTMLPPPYTPAAVGHSSYGGGENPAYVPDEPKRALEGGVEAPCGTQGAHGGDYDIVDEGAVGFSPGEPHTSLQAGQLERHDMEDTINIAYEKLP